MTTRTRPGRVARSRAGRVVQGVIGFGYSFVVVPVLLLVAPATVPAAPLTVALPMVLVLAAADRHALDRGGFARLTLGRCPAPRSGPGCSRSSASTCSPPPRPLLLGAVAASVARGARRTSPRLEVLAGFVSGIAGTVASLGGPYLGLAYADRPAAVLRGPAAARAGRPGPAAPGRPVVRHVAGLVALVEAAL